MLNVTAGISAAVLVVTLIAQGEGGWSDIRASWDATPLGWRIFMAAMFVVTASRLSVRMMEEARR